MKTHLEMAIESLYLYLGYVRNAALDHPEHSSAIYEAAKAGTYIRDDLEHIQRVLVAVEKPKGADDAD